MSGFSIKAAVISGVIGLASVFAMSAGAQAASPVQLMPEMSGNAAIVQVNHRNSNYNRPQNRPNRYACSPREAVSKASRMGIRNARVSSTRSTIRVTGKRYGRHTSVLFGKARGCPVLR